MHQAIAALIFGAGAMPPPDIEVRSHSLTATTAFATVLGNNPRRLALVISNDGTVAIKLRFLPISGDGTGIQFNPALGPLTITVRDHFVLPQYSLQVAAASSTSQVYVTEIGFAE